MKKLTTEEFIKKARKIYGDKFDYSLVNYVNNYTKVKIICPEHGIFEQVPKSHLKGCNCKKCHDLTKITPIEILLDKFKKKHNNKYDYSLIDFNGIGKDIKIICPIHGI